MDLHAEEEELQFVRTHLVTELFPDSTSVLPQLVLCLQNYAGL